MNKDTPIYVSDLESTGLLHHLEEQGGSAKLHNFCAMNIKTDKVILLHNDTHKEREQLTRFLSRECILVMHNSIAYDDNALKFFGYDTSNIHYVDTLALSWYLDINRPKHGLQSYGIEANVPKPEIKDWEDLTQEDYDHRVLEDVRIQQYVYNKLKGRFEELYGKMSDYEFCTHKVVKYLNFKMVQLAEQQNTKFRIDVPRTKMLIEKFTAELDEKMVGLIAVMPKVPVLNKHTAPKKPFKQDGSLSATGLKWKAITEANSVPFDYDGELTSIKGYDEPNPQSSKQVKDWLHSFGWQPATFRYVKEDDGSERKIEQVYIQGSGGAICSSIEDLAKAIPEVEHLVGVGVIKHRIGVLNGILDSLIFDEYIEASAGGFTNTLRLKHRRPYTNIPSTRALYGKEIRSCFIAKEGMVLTGSDLASLENNIKFNLQLPYDRKGVESQLADDYDPHLEIATQGGLITEAQVSFYKIEKEGFPANKYPESEELKNLLELGKIEKKSKVDEFYGIRAKGKSSNYALQYNAFPKTIARTAKIPLKVATDLFDAYKRLNWSIDVIAKSHETKKTSFGTFQKNKFNNMWYYLKNPNDSFSTGVQGSSSYVFDLWLANIFKLRDSGKYDFGERGISLVGQTHDDCVLEHEKGYEKQAKALLEEAVGLVNKMMKVELPFSIDVQSGTDFSQIH